jgi:hypothetical protein
MITARVTVESDGEYLFIIVAAPTGVLYLQQCGGTACDERSQEGFLVQVGEERSAGVIYEWFWEQFQGSCMNAAGWNDKLVTELEKLIAKVSCWYLDPKGQSRLGNLQYLKLDRARMNECVEAWIPVLSPYGPAILVLNNSD